MAKNNLRRRPLGSGVFALAFGIVFIICCFILHFGNIDISTINSNTLFKGWLLVGGSILLGWGINRIINNDGRWIVGQSTINFVVGFIGAAIAILALLKK